MAEIRFQTSRFGEVSLDESRVIHFNTPILGFETLSQYALLDHAEDSPFKWLQSLQNEELAFVVTNPKLFGIPYEFELSDEAADVIGLTSADDAVVFTIVNIPDENPGKLTANLMGPIVVNVQNLRAMQLVLNHPDFSIPDVSTKVRLIPDEALRGQSATPSSATSSGD